MRATLIGVALLVTGLGCDSSALLANIDVYTCAYLPSVIDCTTQEVHDKAVSVLEHGLANADIVCSGTFSGAGFGTYRATKLQDGSCLASGVYSVPYIGLAAFSRAATQFSPRGEPGAGSCSVDIPDSFTMTAEDGEWSFTGTPKAIGAACTGFNLEAFGVEP